MDFEITEEQEELRTILLNTRMASAGIPRLRYAAMVARRGSSHPDTTFAWTRGLMRRLERTAPSRSRPAHSYWCGRGSWKPTFSNTQS